MSACWRARRPRVGARSLILPASQYSSPHRRRTSSPAPRSPSMAAIRSRADVEAASRQAKAPDDAGAFSFIAARGRSVARNQRPAELVAHASDHRLDIVRPRIEGVGARPDTAELIALLLEGRIVIFETDDPVLGDAVFPARANGPAVVPLGLRPRTGGRVRIGVDHRQMVVDAGVSALRIEQIVGHGVADAARHRRHPVGAPAEAIVEAEPEHVVDDGAAVVEAGDRALKTEHPVAGLPVVADLAAAEDTRAALAETLARREIAEEGGVGGVDPFLVRRGAAEMTADIEAGPVIDRLDIGRRLAVRPRAKIRSRRSAHAQRRGDGQSSNQFCILHVCTPLSHGCKSSQRELYQMRIAALRDAGFSLDGVKFPCAVARASLFGAS